MTIVALHTPTGTVEGFGHEVVRLSQPGLSSVYEAIATEHPLVSEVVPGDGSPVILVGWSAGVFAIRQWLRDPRNRETVAGVVLLDGLHAAGPPCNVGQLDGVLAFVRSGKPVIVTHSAIVPPGYASTTDCAEALRRATGGPPNLEFVGTRGSDADEHVAHATTIGKAAVGRMVQRVAGQGGPARTAGGSGPPALALLLLAAGGAYVGWQVWKGRAS